MKNPWKWFRENVTFYPLDCAMHGAVNIKTKRWGYICFKPPTKSCGRWWPAYLYLSPNGTPWASTLLWGREYSKPEKMLAQIRKAIWGHGYDCHVNDPQRPHDYFYAFSGHLPTGALRPWTEETAFAARALLRTLEKMMEGWKTGAPQSQLNEFWSQVWAARDALQTTMEREDLVAVSGGIESVVIRLSVAEMKLDGSASSILRTKQVETILDRMASDVTTLIEKRESKTYPVHNAVGETCGTASWHGDRVLKA